MRNHWLVCIAAITAAVCLPLLAEQGTGYVKTKVSPSRAGVFIDGKYVGPAGNFAMARKYAVAPGEHEVRLSEPRYEDIVTKITVQSGQTTKLEQTMKPVPLAKPPFGRLRTISADKYAAVYVNGKFMGHAGEFNNPLQGLKLNPGDYIVKIVPAGSDQGAEQKVKIEANKVTICR